MKLYSAIALLASVLFYAAKEADAAGGQSRGLRGASEVRSEGALQTNRHRKLMGGKNKGFGGQNFVAGTPVGGGGGMGGGMNKGFGGQNFVAAVPVGGGGGMGGGMNKGFGGQQNFVAGTPVAGVGGMGGGMNKGFGGQNFAAAGAPVGGGGGGGGMGGGMNKGNGGGNFIVDRTNTLAPQDGREAGVEITVVQNTDPVWVGDMGDRNDVPGGNNAASIYDVGTKSIMVAIKYSFNPQDIGWHLFNLQWDREVLFSNYDSVTEPGVVIQRVDNVPGGAYELIMFNRQGGTFSGVEWVKILDATDYAYNPETSADVAVMELEFAGKVVFQHMGGFGAMLARGFMIY